MRRLRFTLSMLGLALAAIPALATITYTSCSDGSCSSTSGSYAGMPSAPGATGLAFSSPITFVSAGLAGTGIYTDTGAGTGGTGTVFTNYSSGGTVDPGTQINGGSFLQWNYTGTGTGIEIDLPANTFAFAMSVTTCNGGSCGSVPFNAATVGWGTQSSHGTTYDLTISGGAPVQFFGIVSSTAITSLFLTSNASAGNLSIKSFELGQEEISDTPEAGTFFSMGAGLLCLYFLRRPRLRKLVAARVQAVVA